MVISGKYGNIAHFNVALREIATLVEVTHICVYLQKQ